MAKTHNVVARIRYSQGGDEKSKWVTIGAAFDGEKGQSLKIDAVPVGPGWDGWLYLMSDDKKEAQQAPAKRKAPTFDDSDAPF